MPGDPRGVRRQAALERLDLAQGAAQVRVRGRAAAGRARRPARRRCAAAGSCAAWTSVNGGVRSRACRGSRRSGSRCRGRSRRRRARPRRRGARAPRRPSRTRARGRCRTSSRGPAQDLRAACGALEVAARLLGERALRGRRRGRAHDRAHQPDEPQPRTRGRTSGTPTAPCVSPAGHRSSLAAEGAVVRDGPLARRSAHRRSSSSARCAHCANGSPSVRCSSNRRATRST